VRQSETWIYVLQNKKWNTAVLKTVSIKGRNNEKTAQEPQL
jgi:hypothetical protein